MVTGVDNWNLPSKVKIHNSLVSGYFLIKTRRVFLRSLLVLAATTSVAGIPNTASAAEAAGLVSMKEAVELRRRPQFLSDFILRLIKRYLKRGADNKDYAQILEYIDKNPDQLLKDISKVVKQLQSGKFEELPDEEFASIKIKFRFKFKPPSSFEASLEITF